MALIFFHMRFLHTSDGNACKQFVSFHFCLATQRGKDFLFSCISICKSKEVSNWPDLGCKLTLGRGEGFCDGQSHQNLLVEWGEKIPQRKGCL